MHFTIDSISPKAPSNRRISPLKHIFALHLRLWDEPRNPKHPNHNHNPPQTSKPTLRINQPKREIVDRKPQIKTPTVHKTAHQPTARPKLCICRATVRSAGSCQPPPHSILAAQKFWERIRFQALPLSRLYRTSLLLDLAEVWLSPVQQLFDGGHVDESRPENILTPLSREKKRASRARQPETRLCRSQPRYRVSLV